MRESVSIVLNEREPSKARAAETLQKALADLGLTSCRIEVTDRVEEVVIERRCPILILDYLLGDFSTGLDVLASLQDLAPEQRPQVFFLTDEPSVQVAVDAMRQGANNYFEIDSPNAIPNLVRQVATTLSKGRAVRAPAEAMTSRFPYFKSLDDFIAHSNAARDFSKQFRAAIGRAAPLIVLLGPVGADHSELARLYHLEAHSNSAVTQYSLRTATEPAEIIFGLGVSHFGSRLGLDRCVTIEHAEEDDGELLEYLCDHRRHIWKDSGYSTLSGLIVNTTDESQARAWTRALPEAELLIIPSLAVRRDDLPSLVQMALIAAADMGGAKIRSASPRLIEWVAGQNWPGDVQQLRGTLINASFDALNEPIHDPANLIALVEARRLMWDEINRVQGDFPEITPLLAAHTLERFDFRFRAAAAALGCSVRKLHNLLETPKSSAGTRHSVPEETSQRKGP